MSKPTRADDAAQLSPELARESGGPPRPSLGHRIRHNYALGRILKSLITIWAVATLSFVLVRWMPGDPLQAYVQRLMSQQGLSREEALARASSLLSYDPNAPLLEQYLDYLTGLLRGNLGQSIVAPGTSVTDYILAYLPWTLFSVGLGLLLSFLIGVAFGVLIAYKRGSWLDHLVTNISSALNAVPNYMWAMLVIVVFGVQLRWFNVSALRGTVTPGVHPGFTAEFIVDALAHAALPIAVYTLTSVGGWILQMKSSTTQVLEDDYVVSARARGLPSSRIHVSYVGRNAILPLFTQFAVQLGFVVGGSTLVEQIFKYDGVGYYFYDAIEARDYPVVQGFILIITVSVVLANLLADLLLSRIDPRIRVAGAH
ncbi:ABC transporter permease [Tessaracoccus sp. OH4464_COT-324]|uniref:ABC transporter permease n=1 Tax=Tessaracoccus sp. OH4464_COT-324 TaxID=2491059 RepID=UPI000F63B714|nr:ABC transporter permease [Tessaracoccus sp. OH4464_COT-324]RRD45878.1 ABC transporter permease [Tessaracoccus sp. OH4464_COT-324]